MAMVTLSLVVPEERVDAIYAAASGVPEKAASAPPPAPTPRVDAPWAELAPDAVRANLAEFEQRLLRRLAYARGQRVPLSELSSDFGLPKTANLAEDFPGLTAFCNEAPSERPFPVRAAGDGGDDWYWMSPTDASAFEFAFDPSPESAAPQSALDHNQMGPGD